jgi:hypothetical protein
MRPTAFRLLMVVLSLNAILLLVLLLAVVRGGELMPAAFGQVPSSGQSDVRFVVTPAQLSVNTWGCFVLDTSNQTMCVYQYSPGEKILRLHAARGISQDMQLKNFNTTPAPAEVTDLVETASRIKRGAPASQPSMPPAESEKK